MDDATQHLEANDPKLGELVRLQFFAELSFDKTAEVLSTWRFSVIRHWHFARAFLALAIQKARECSSYLHSFLDLSVSVSIDIEVGWVPAIHV
jgi:hypothetical protein